MHQYITWIRIEANWILGSDKRPTRGMEITKIKAKKFDQES